MVEAGIALIVTRRRASMLMPPALYRGITMISGSKRLCFACWAERCRQQPAIRVEPEAQHSDQHDCKVPAPANYSLLRLL